VIVAVENVEPYVVQVYRVPDVVLELGREEYGAGSTSSRSAARTALAWVLGRHGARAAALGVLPTTKTFQAEGLHQFGGVSAHVPEEG
jgi:hypothetical protein